PRWPLNHKPGPAIARTKLERSVMLYEKSVTSEIPHLTRRAFFSASLLLVFAFTFSTCSAQYADSVVAFSSGAGAIPGYADPTRALGAPTTFIGYQNADPFNPPYQSTHLVS